MAASLGWYESDETTAVATLDLGSVPPGSSYNARNGAYRELRVKNDGTEDFASVDVEIQQVSGDAAYAYLRVAPESGTTPGTPDTFQDYVANPLALGALVAGAAAALWVDAIVPAGAAAQDNQSANLAILGSL